MAYKKKTKTKRTGVKSPALKKAEKQIADLTAKLEASQNELTEANHNRDYFKRRHDELDNARRREQMQSDGEIAAKGQRETVVFTAAIRAHQELMNVKPLAAQTQQTQQTTTTAPAIDPAVKKAGEEAAAKGVDVYTTWLGSLTPEVKATVRPFHTEWTAKARAFVPPKEEDEIPFDDMPADNGEEDDAPNI